MSEKHVRGASATPPADPARPRGVRLRSAILRVSGLSVAAVLAALMVTAVVPPIVADQSDRAVVNAPITLLTAPIGGEVAAVDVAPGDEVRAGDTLARIRNPRVDRSTLISLEERASDAREKLTATTAKKDSDRSYLAALDADMAGQTEQMKRRLQGQIEELRARVAQSQSMSGEKKALVDRQSGMVARATASMDMLRPTTQQYSAALHATDAENAKLAQKIGQLEALDKGIYVGEDLVALNTLAQKRRDIDLDAQRMAIEERELSALLADRQRLIDTERGRLDRLTSASVDSAGPGKVLTVGAAPGRHLNAGDTVASVVDCDRRFVVAIFSYRQGQVMAPGTKVRIDGIGSGVGTVSAVLPKTSDKSDEGFAVPFPQTERRELYAIISPTDPAARFTAAVDGIERKKETCPVGQWVTVTRDDGIVPSMSVSWRRLERLVGWRRHEEQAPDPASPSGAATHRAGLPAIPATAAAEDRPRVAAQ